jgi:hypothetical protein
MNLTEQLEVIAAQDIWERPERARALILEGLRSSEEGVRWLAAGLAADDLDPELVSEIERLLDHDPAERVRVQAVATLGSVFEQMGILDSWQGPEFDDAPMPLAQFRRIKGKLETLYRDVGVPEEIRRRALEALVRAPEGWHREAVRRAWSGDEPGWQVTAVRCMGHVEGFDAQILEALHGDSPDLKYAALAALFDAPLEESGDEVLRLATCDQTPRELRLTAFDVLTILRPRGSLDALGSLLDSDDHEISEAAGEAFAELAADEDLEAEYDEDFEPYAFDADDPMDAYGLYEAECAGCDSITRVNDLMLCEECAAKLDRDLIRQRDWDYSATAWACPEPRREELRAQVIREHGAKLELIVPSDPKRSKKDRGSSKRKRRRKR